MENTIALAILCGIVALFFLPFILAAFAGYYGFRFAQWRNPRDLGWAIFLAIIAIILW